MPVGLTLSSLIRRSRVIRRGEPGGRRNPRDFSSLASVSMSTEWSAVRATSSRTTSTISSWGAV